MSLNPRAIATNGIGFAPNIVALQGFSQVIALTQYAAKGAGQKSHHYFERTERNSDRHAYDSNRVAERLEAVVIAGKTYDPFDPNLIDIIESAAKQPEPDHLPEIERQERKLARTFTVMTEHQIIEVPLFRPMLREMPNFAGAWSYDFEDYAARAREEANEERKRILMLLTASDWP